MSLPIIAITMGDAAGVGPELCLKALSHPALRAFCVPIVLGDATLLKRVAAQCELPIEAPIVGLEDVANLTEPAIVDLAYLQDPDAVVPGTFSADTGRAAYLAIETSIQLANAGHIQGIATAPICKEALHAAGYTQYPGHTEIYTEQMRAQRSCMMLTAPEITCSLVTIHVGLREVPALLTVQGILDVIELTHAAMSRICGRPARLAVLGLNPHAGENGLFGDQEEERLIVPAMELARAQGIELEGPLPPDTAFLPRKRANIDAYVCMYHDQGLIPLKTLAFDDAVNTTLGLPTPRTSVDHGTAFDIAWKNVANPNSLFLAVELAAKMAR